MSAEFHGPWTPAQGRGDSCILGDAFYLICHTGLVPVSRGRRIRHMSRSYYVYILASDRNGTLYVGVTNDLVRRVHEHKTSATEGFTKRYKVHRLVWFGETGDVTAAIAREKTINNAVTPALLYCKGGPG